jgi:hypothetical protein
MPKRGRTTLAFLVAPVMAPIVFMLSGILFSFVQGTGLTTTTEPAKELFAWVVLVSIFSLPVSYVAMLAFGVPTIIVLEKLGRLSLFWLVVASAIEGVIVIFVFFWVDSGFSLSHLFAERTLLPRVVTGSTMAIGVAVAFWYISGHNHLFHGAASLTRRRPVKRAVMFRYWSGGK